MRDFWKIYRSADLEGSGGAEPEPVAPVEIEVAAAESTSPEPTPTEDPAPRQDPPHWTMNRLAKLAGQKAKLAEENAALKARLAENIPGVDPAEVERLALNRAAQLEFDRQCNEVASQGRKEFPDFNRRVEGLLQLVDRQDPEDARAYNNLILAAMETGEAHKVLHALGGDAEKAAEILAMSPVKMGMAVAKLAALGAAGNPAPPPKPLKPIGARGTSHTDISPRDPVRADNLDTATWMARRNAEIAARR